MKSLKVSEIMRISGLTLEEITTRFAKSDIIIKDESQEVSVYEYKRAMASKSKDFITKQNLSCSSSQAPAKIISSTTESIVDYTNNPGGS